MRARQQPRMMHTLSQQRCSNQGRKSRTTLWNPCLRLFGNYVDVKFAMAEPAGSSSAPVHVLLPSHSHSFDVYNLPRDATVADLKHAISEQCLGRPQASGQRIIMQGRLLMDGESLVCLHTLMPSMFTLLIRMRSHIASLALYISLCILQRGRRAHHHLRVAQLQGSLLSLLPLFLSHLLPMHPHPTSLHYRSPYSCHLFPLNLSLTCMQMRCASYLDKLLCLGLAQMMSPTLGESHEL